MFYNIFLYASILPKTFDYTFYCTDSSNNQKTFSLYLDYFLDKKNYFNLKYVAFNNTLSLQTDAIFYQNNKIQINDFEHSKQKLDLLFTPLTIQPSDQKADLALFDFFYNRTLDELLFIKKWYEILSIKLSENVTIHEQYKTNGKYNDSIQYNDCNILAIYKYNNKNNNKACFNLSYFNKLINFADNQKITATHNYLCKLDELETADKISTIILDDTNAKLFTDGSFLEELRKIFVNLSTISFQNRNRLVIPITDGTIFQNILYDNNNNYRPLQFIVNNSAKAHKNMQRSVLLFYKYYIMHPLSIMYVLLNSLLLINEISIMATLDLSNSLAEIIGLFLFIEPLVHLFGAWISHPYCDVYRNKVYDFTGFEIDPKSFINTSDYFFIFSITLHFCYLMVLKNEIPLKTLLKNRIFIIGLLIFIQGLKGFKDEILVFNVLFNKNIFINLDK